ncbi:MAG: oligosaccharide flippase family protein, partial [Gammaproteobacteria bacterium]|nr:oligosaccharide flippase family protein [Gammaproteobacteria bacterium]
GLVMLIPGIGAAAPVYLATFPIVLGSLLFPTWLFQGLEIMHFTTIFSVGGRLLATAGIFVFVQGPGDVVTAAFLQASATALSGLLAVPVLYGRLRLRFRTPWRRLAAGLRRTLADARSLAPAEYLSDALNNSGVFILGLFASDAVVGVYAAIEKVARAAASLFQPLTKALFPALAGRWMHCAATAVDDCRVWSLRLILLATATSLCLYAAAPLGLEIVFGAGWGDQAALLRIFAAWLVLHVVSLALGQFGLLARGDRGAYTRCLIFTGAFQLAVTVGGAWWLGAAGLVTALACTEMLRAVLFTSTIAGRRAEANACVF